MVVVKLFSSTYKWSVAKLIESTSDRDRWTVRWYGATATPRIDSSFKPAWAVYNARGSIVEELYTDTQPQRRNFIFETCTGIIKIKHIIGVPWASSEFIAHLGKIPANVRATIKQRFRSEFW